MYQRQSPDYSQHVAKCAELFPAEWDRANKEKYGDRTEEFILKCASYIHDVVGDKKVGNNGKRGGTEKSRDALAYLNDTAPGGAEVIDVIIGAGHKPTWADATIPPCPHPQCREDVPEGVLGRFIQPEPYIGPGDPPPPSDGTHTYNGGGNDTGICDTCGKPRMDPIHATPQSKQPHVYDGGEQDTGQCDVCGQGKAAAIHQGNPPPIDPPDTPPATCGCKAELEAIMKRLDVHEGHFGKIVTSLEAIAQKPPVPVDVTFPVYEGKVFGQVVRLIPVKPKP